MEHLKLSLRGVRRIQVIDSHTGGEPTRVVIKGGPDLGGGAMAARLERFRSEFDPYRSAIVNEPRGSDVMVGALLLPPSDPECTAGVIYFNNVGCLGMCGHGTIGLVATLAYLKRIEPGEYRIETPVGIVRARLHESGDVSVSNVPSYRFRKDVPIFVPGVGEIVGDIAWGGNWFFLVQDHGLAMVLKNIEALTEFTWKIRQELERAGITGAGGQDIDHIELFASSLLPGVQSKNFVLCPGKAFDRSPCGTGTSAKLACLYTDGKIKEGEVWRQESITGSVFEGVIENIHGALIPTIRGSAYITSEASLVLDPADPLCWGIA